MSTLLSIRRRRSFHQSSIHSTVGVNAIARSRLPFLQHKLRIEFLAHLNMLFHEDNEESKTRKCYGELSYSLQRYNIDINDLVFDGSWQLPDVVSARYFVYGAVYQLATYLCVTKTINGPVELIVNDDSRKRHASNVDEGAHERTSRCCHGHVERK